MHIKLKRSGHGNEVKNQGNWKVGRKNNSLPNLAKVQRPVTAVPSGIFALRKRYYAEYN